MGIRHRPAALGPGHQTGLKPAAYAQRPGLRASSILASWPDRRLAGTPSPIHGFPLVLRHREAGGYGFAECMSCLLCMVFSVLNGERG